MGQQGFGGMEACADIEACGVIQDVEEGLFVGVAGGAASYCQRAPRSRACQHLTGLGAAL